MLVHNFYPEKNITQNLTNVVISNPKATVFENKIAFLGFDMNSSELRTSESFHIVYFWKSLEEVDIDYTVFVHFTDEKGNIALQQDHDLPLQTSQWKRGDIIMEEYDVEVPTDVKAGEYDLRIGLYEILTGERLSIVDYRNYTIGDNKVIERIKFLS